MTNVRFGRKSAADRLAGYERLKTRVLELHAEGMAPAVISQTLGSYQRAVDGILATEGRVPFRERAASAAIAVPAWVPQHLIARYQDVAALEGEEAAASECRRLKHAGAAA